MDVEEAARQLEEQQQRADAAETKPNEVPAITTIEIDVTTQRGTRYQGRFYFKVPTLGEQIDIGRIKAVMMPSGTPDPTAATLVEALAYLQVTIKFGAAGFPKPEWYRPASEMYDDDPFLELYGRCREYENTFRGWNKKRGADDAPAGEANGPAGTGAPPVGRKVRPPSKRRETLAGDGEGST